MRTLFDTLDQELFDLEHAGYDGATLFAIRQQRRLYSKRLCPPGAREARKANALASFWAFHGSEVNVDRTVAEMIRAKLGSWLSQYCLNDTLSPANADAEIDALRKRLADGLTPGPGSSVGLHGRTTSPYMKVTSQLVASSHAALREWRDLVEAFRPDLVLAQSCSKPPTLALGARVTTVPKNSTTDRVIAIEPEVNVQLQAALGRELARVCSCVGLDLTTQQDRNRELAWLGSVDGSLATVDLSRASDSISMELLRLVLPSWLLSLVVVYSSHLVDDAGVRRYGRVVLTMGNGITFPLQTLIWFAATCVACELSGVRYVVNKNVACFGDDIICPSEAYDTLLVILQKMGAHANADKSFATGPFRESCGTDWYQGFAVRPFMFEGWLESVQDLYCLYNLATAWEIRTGVLLPLFKGKLVEEIHKWGKLRIVPMHAPIDGGIRALRPDRFSRYVKGANGYTYSFVVTKFKRRRLPNEGHPFITQAVLHGWLICDRRSVSIAERPRQRGTVSLRKGFSSTWGVPDPCDKWLYNDSLHPCRLA